jgi:hypothetical protein
VEYATQVGPGVAEDSQFLDKLQTGSVCSFGCRREHANGTCSGDTGRMEVGTRVEAGEVSVAQECLVAQSNRVAILVDSRK